MKTEKVYSKIYDKNIQDHIETSQIWKECEHSEDVRGKNITGWYEYTIKFDGLKPIQCNHIQKINY